ncbi:MAG TPA: hypothetical protein VGK73_22850 [Polyangiaceae bacterium]
MTHAERGRRGAGALVLVLAVAGAAAQASCAGEIGADPAVRESARCLSEAGELFEQRIAPLLATDRPKTCNQCHLSGVDLSLFVRDDMCETRACLLELGLVDTGNPADSVVLGWIQRAHPDSELITEAVIQEEYEGMKAFVERIATCSGAACAGVRCPMTGDDEACGSEPEPGEPSSVPEGTPCDALTIEQTFRDTAYVWRDRCFPCHFTSQPQSSLAAPPWIDVRGNCEAGSIATLRNWEHGGYMNLEEPAQSLVLLKPLPLDQGGVEHGGDAKFSDRNDETYLSFLSFIEYYAACANGATTP